MSAFHAVHLADGVLPEGTPGVRDAVVGVDGTAVVEACFSAGARCALLYAENLPAASFDLSSGVVGAVLQRLRNYRIRLAVVLMPGTVTPSHRFGEMLAEEARGREFGVSPDRAAAIVWLSAS